MRLQSVVDCGFHLAFVRDEAKRIVLASISLRHVVTMIPTFQLLMSVLHCFIHGQYSVLGGYLFYCYRLGLSVNILLNFGFCF